MSEIQSVLLTLALPIAYAVRLAWVIYKANS